MWSVPAGLSARRVRARVQAMVARGGVEWRVSDGLQGQGVGIIEVEAVGRHSSSLGYDNDLDVIGCRPMSDDPGFAIPHDIIVENVKTSHQHLTA